MGKTDKKLFKKSLSTQLGELLEEALDNEEWPVGSRMPSEPELAEMYGVSRNTVREAVHYLAISGLVDVRPGDGTYVRNRTALSATMEKRLEREELACILEVRRLIEPDVCALACERKNEEDLAILQKMHTELINSFNNKLSDYLDRDIAFHIQIGKMCGNPLLNDIYRSIISHYPIIFKEGFLSFIESEDCEIYLHNQLLNFIIDGDSEKARKLTIEMLQAEAADYADVYDIRKE